MQALHHFVQRTKQVIVGAIRNADAKITGITPAALTFNGKCVVDHPFE